MTQFADPPLATQTPTGAAEMLEALAHAATNETARAAFRRAARAIAQQPGGRPAVDDRAALREISDLLARGAARSFREAASKVARARFPFAVNHRSIAERFRRKAKKSATKRF